MLIGPLNVHRHALFTTTPPPLLLTILAFFSCANFVQEKPICYSIVDYLPKPAISVKHNRAAAAAAQVRVNVEGRRRRQ